MYIAQGIKDLTAEPDRINAVIPALEQMGFRQPTELPQPRKPGRPRKDVRPAITNEIQ